MASTDTDAISFCKIDAHLDSNPKIRKAGRDGRDVFEFIVRRNSLMERDGSVPIRYIEPWYLADVLMMTEEEASHGVSRAVTACLIEVDKSQGVVRIVGWTPDWGRTRRSDAERKADQRAREKAIEDAKSAKTPEPVTPNRDMSREVTDVTHKIRGEEIRGEEIRDQEKNSARPAAGGSRSRKSKPSEPTAPELAVVSTVLEKLGKHTGTSYSGAAEHKRLIIARLRDGLGEWDLRKVIAYCALPSGLGWSEKPEMLPYLRPETLFGPKTIAKYLDPARSWFAKEFPDAEERGS